MVLQLLLLVLIIWLLARQIGQRLSAEQASSRADARAASVLQTVREPIVVLDRDQRVLLHNAAFAELYAIDEDDLAERHPRLDELSDAWTTMWCASAWPTCWRAGASCGTTRSSS